MKPCPSNLKRELYLYASANEETSKHISQCQVCQEWVRLAEQHEREFRGRRRPLSELQSPGHLRLQARSWSFLAPMLATTAMVAMVALPYVNRPSAPVEDIRAKGPGLGLTVYHQVDGVGRRLREKETIPSGTALRFEVKIRRPCYLTIASIDSTKTVSKLYPPSGHEPFYLEQTQLLPGGAVLVGEGPEQLHVLCSSAPIPFPDIESALRIHDVRDELTLRNGGQGGVNHENIDEATFLIEISP